MYATIDDIKAALNPDVLLRLVDDEREGLTAVGELRAKQQARITKALRDATAEADAYVGQRYRLPLATVPNILNKKVVDIASYNLFSRRGIQGGTADETVSDCYDNAIKFLKDVALGRASLPLPDEGGGSSGTASQAGAAKIEANPRLFTRKKMDGF